MPNQVGVIALSLLLTVTSSLAGSARRTAAGTNLNTLLMPPARLAQVKAALPPIADPALQGVLDNPQTIWYDATVMTPSYQDSVGANANAHWPDLVAASEDVIDGLHNRALHRWQFPFGATAGTDNATNLQIENFILLPQTGGQPQTVNITTIVGNDDRLEWTWTYPTGTVVGEILFITDGANLLPIEIRTRTRYASGWSMNVFRPFPKAAALAARIQQLRPDWAATPSLKAMIDFLGDGTTLQPASLAAQAGIASTFSQSGYLDTLPDFGDDDLVRQLLTTTPFRAAYGAVWKQNGSAVTYAPTTNSRLSIVPVNYTAGLIEVSDDSCMRCHKESSRNVSDFYDDLYLYGEMWGMDGIFTFHPYDESLYPRLREDGFDNRALNPKLRDAGIFQTSFSPRLRRHAR